MIDPRLHAALDAVSAAGLMLAPTLLGWPKALRGPLFAAGAGVAGYSLATRYRPGQAGALSLDAHRVFDAAQGAAFCLAASRMRAPAPVRRTLAAYGAFSLAAAALTRDPQVRRVGRQVPLAREAVIGRTRGTRVVHVAPGLALMGLGIVNVAFLGPEGAGDGEWLLVDAGLTGTAGTIAAAAAQRFRPGARPAAIVLTHGHFDHVGALETLARRWDVPVYAHPREMPFLDGSRAYPQGDPSVGGGLMAALAPFYPTAPVNVWDRLRPLPEDGSLPGVAGWRWLHTPGHSPGHVSFWREADRCLLAGDAVITTRQESAYAALTQRAELHGPPAYFTTDWEAARHSVEALADLAPRVLATGHGAPVAGPEIAASLDHLARHFSRLAMPRGTRFTLEDQLQPKEV